MVITSFQIPSLFALTLLSASAPQGFPPELLERPVHQPLQPGTRLDVVLAPGAEHRFQLRHGARGPVPGGTAVAERGAESAGSRAPAAHTLNLTLAVQRCGRGRERVLTATLRPERGSAIVYYVLVDPRAQVDRLRRHRVAAEPDGVDHDEACPEPSDAEVRRYVELALGSGLHASRLEKGGLYVLGETGTPRGSVRDAMFAPQHEERAPLDELTLQFQGIGVGRAARVARFGLTLPDAVAGSTPPTAHARTIDPDTERVLIPAGDASYSLADGLLVRLSYRPRAEATPAGGADWLEIERILD